MNKLLTKIVGLSLGLSMAIGVGVAASTSKPATEVSAITSGSSVAYSYTFEAKQFSNDSTAKTLASTSPALSVKWTPTTSWSVGTGYWGYDATKGQQWGSSSHTLDTMTIESDVSFTNVTDIVINASIASSGGCKLTTKVGSTSIGSERTLTTTATEYTQTDASGLTGAVSITLSNGSKKKAQYIKSIVIYTKASQTYTVSFNGNGASGSMSDVTEVSGSYTLPANGFTVPTGKVFSGWKANNTGDLIPAGGSYTVGSNVTFYAQWANAYSVTYTAGTHGSGSYVHASQPEGNYTLIPFTDLTGVSASSGYKFASYTVGGVTKNPGDTITLSSATSVTVNFEEKGLDTTYVFATNFATYASGWTTTYGEKTLNGKTDVGGDYSATIILNRANKQSSGIGSEEPFLASPKSTTTSPILVFTLNEDGYKIKDVIVTFTQRGTNAPTFNLYKGNACGGAALDSATIGSSNSLEANQLNDTSFSLDCVATSASNNVGAALTSIYISIEETSSFGTLDHIRATSLPNVVYHVGESYSSIGLTVTAYDNADESVANFKDVTSLATYTVNNGYTFVTNDVPSVTNTIEYEEGDIAKTTSFIVHVYALAQYELVTSEPTDWSGNYLIVGTNSDENLCAMNGSLTNPDVEKDYKVVSDTDNIIEAGQELEWNIAAISGGYSVQGTSGKYIGRAAASNGMDVSDSALLNTISMTDGNITIAGSGGYKINLNHSGDRFRYYSSGTVQLYKKVESSAGDLYAQTFLGAFTCDNGAHEPSFTIKEGSTYWSWALLKEEYNKLSNEDKEDFRIGTPSESGTNIQQAIARYDAVIRHWGEAKYENFMNRTITPVGGLKVAFGLFEDPNTSITIIVAISAISLTSVGAFFALRKRRENI